MPRPRKELDMDMVKDMYVRRNMTYKQIGDALGVANTTIRNRLKSAGIKGRSNAFEPKNPDVIIDLYRDGESLMDIGMKYGVSQSTIRDFLIKCGVPRRSLSEARKTLLQKEQSAVSRPQKAESRKPTASLADKARTLRKEQNLTIDEIAERLNLKKVDVYDILF